MLINDSNTFSTITIQSNVSGKIVNLFGSIKEFSDNYILEYEEDSIFNKLDPIARWKKTNRKINISIHLLAEDESPLLFATPLIYSSIVLTTGVKIGKNPENVKLIDVPAYRDGYKKVAKGKKVFRSFASSGIGMLASFLVFSAID